MFVLGGVSLRNPVAAGDALWFNILFVLFERYTFDLEGLSLIIRWQMHGSQLRVSFNNRIIVTTNYAKVIV